MTKNCGTQIKTRWAGEIQTYGLAIICVIFLANCGGGNNSNSSTSASPPQTTFGPSATDTTDTSTTLLVSINKDGTGYYIVQPAAEAAPSISVVRAGISFSMSANTIASATVTDLAIGTPYSIYFIATDSTNNTQVTVQSATFTTDAPLPSAY